MRNGRKATNQRAPFLALVTKSSIAALPRVQQSQRVDPITPPNSLSLSENSLEDSTTFWVSREFETMEGERSTSFAQCFHLYNVENVQTTLQTRLFLLLPCKEEKGYGDAGFALMICVDL